MPSFTRIVFFCSALLSPACVSVTAFSVSPANNRNPTRPDTSALVEQALKTTATYGIASPEAKVAWDIVEEMDASDNSEATKGSLDQECEVETPSAECLDYGRFLDELVVVRNAMGQSKQKLSLVDALQAIRINAPEGVKAKSSPELTQALQAAKQATSEHGVTSVEARLAWETYEEIASAGYENTVNVVSLLEECSVEAAGEDACKAMEELRRVMPILMSLESK